MIASVATYPHEVLRTRLQIQKHAVDTGTTAGDPHPYEGIGKTCRKIMRDEGAKGFYRGMGVNLLRTVPASAMTILTCVPLLLLPPPCESITDPPCPQVRSSDASSTRPLEPARRGLARRLSDPSSSPEPCTTSPHISPKDLCQPPFASPPLLGRHPSQRFADIVKTLSSPPSSRTDASPSHAPFHAARAVRTLRLRLDHLTRLRTHHLPHLHFSLDAPLPLLFVLIPLFMSRFGLVAVETCRASFRFVAAAGCGRGVGTSCAGTARCTRLRFRR